MRKDQGLWKCNYFHRMGYSFFTITSLPSKKIRPFRRSNSEIYIRLQIIIIDRYSLIQFCVYHAYIVPVKQFSSTIIKFQNLSSTSRRIISQTFGRGHLLKNRISVRDSAIVTIEQVQEMICRESNGIFSLTFSDPERPDQGHLLKNRVSVRDSAVVTIEHVQEVICREWNGIISLTFGDLKRPNQGHLLKNRVSVRDSAIVITEHVQEMICRESKGIFSSTLGDLERSNQGHLQKNRVSVRDSARVTIEHSWELICHESNGIISLTFGDLESSR